MGKVGAHRMNRAAIFAAVLLLLSTIVFPVFQVSTGRTPAGLEPSALRSDISKGFNQPSLKFNVTFTETGLPFGMTWFVNISGGPPLSSSASAITTVLVNGTYSYSVGVANATYSAPGGSFTVNGSSLSLPVAFSESTYSVTFTEVGRPSGTTWYVNLTDGQSYGSKNSTISFKEPNGSYTYRLTQFKGYTSTPSSGSIRVNGANAYQFVIYKLLFEVTFEAFLPAGVNLTWFINLTYYGTSFSSNNSTLSFYEPNGSYYYSIGTTNHTYYWIGGEFNVTGGPVDVPFSFQVYIYAVNIIETGLPLGTVWTETFDGTSVTLDQPVAYNVADNGTHSYTIAAVPGYRASVSSGTVIVDGSGVNITVVFTAVNSTSPLPSMPTHFNKGTLYLLAGGGAGIAMIALVAALVLSRRRRSRKL